MHAVANDANNREVVNNVREVNMSFSDKEYDRLYGICERWTLPQEDVFYAIENNLLRVCVWLPLRFVERGTIKDGKFLFEQQEYKKGFLAIRSEGLSADL
jgi:hypothetical protein